MYKIEDITKPISSPVTKIRESNLYVTLEALMHQENDTLPKGAWEYAETKRDWKQIKEICLKILVEHSKDMQVMSWLMEASLISSFNNIASIWEALDYLLDHFWEDTEVDFSYKAFVHLNKVLKKSLPYMMHLYQKDSEKYTMADLIKSKERAYFEKLGDDEYKLTLSNIELARDILKKINTKTEDAIMNSSIEILDQFKGEILSINNHDVQEKTVETLKSDNNNITSREQAYRTIKDVMNYLKEHDPHSATQYLLKKACEWESKSFVEILNEFNDPVIIAKLFNPKQED